MRGARDAAMRDDGADGRRCYCYLPLIYIPARPSRFTDAFRRTLR